MAQVVVFQLDWARRDGYYVVEEGAGWTIHETWFATREEAYEAGSEADLPGMWFVARVTANMATVARNT